jgi:hypothetical protein
MEAFEGEGEAGHGVVNRLALTPRINAASIQLG